MPLMARPPLVTPRRASRPRRGLLADMRALELQSDGLRLWRALAGTLESMMRQGITLRDMVGSDRRLVLAAISLVGERIGEDDGGVPDYDESAHDGLEDIVPGQRCA